MIFDWREYETLAKWLYENASMPGSTEASYRAAASRAYYAAFQCAMDFAIKEGFEPENDGVDHGNLLKHFRAQRSVVRDRIHTSLHRMRDNRNQADYDSELMSKPQALADSTLNEAKKLFDALEQLKG